MSINDPVRVSVVVPFVDNHEEVLQFKKSLDAQTYPKQYLEIIFVDNGSKRPFSYSEEFRNDVSIMKENKFLNSPYSARNRGIEAAKGDVIILADANSRPVHDWIEHGIRCLEVSGGSIAAGGVQFYLGEKPAAAHIADALTSVNMRKAVLERGVAYTANLFIRKEVLERVGLFEEGSRSGGDVRWSMKAAENGYSISFCEHACVYKYPRSLKGLIKKKIRTGRGYFYTWKKEKEKPVWFFNLFRSLKPPSFSRWKDDPERLAWIHRGSKPGIWFTLWFIGIAEQISFVMEFFRYNLGTQRDIDRRDEIQDS